MRRFLLWVTLAFPAVGILATGPHERALAQPKDDPAPGEGELVAPEKLGKLTLTLDPGGHTAVIERVFFTPDSKQLITLGIDHCIRIWDVETGQPVKALYPPGYGPLSAAALSPDGKRLAVASIYQEGETPRHLVYLLTLPDGHVERVLKGHTQIINSLAYSGDGKRLASSSKDRTIRIWNPDREEPAQVLKKQKYTQRLALSPDGNRLACMDQGKKGVILDLAAGKEVAAIDGGNTIAPAWSPDGKTLATGSKDKFQLWDPDGKLRSQKLEGKPIKWIAFSRDAPTVLVAWIGKHFLRATLLDVATGKDVGEFQPKGIKYPAGLDGDLAPDGRYAATGGGGGGVNEVFIWNMKDGTIHKRLAAKGWIVGGSNTRAAWSADGKAVSWREKPKSPSFHLGDLQFGPSIPEKEAHGAVRRNGDLSLERVSNTGAVRVLKEGKQVAYLNLGERVADTTLVGKDQAAVAGSYGNFWLFDANTGKVIRRFANRAWSIAPSPDARFLFTVSHEQMLRIYSLDRDKPLLTLYVHGQDWIIWTPEGYYAATPGGERLMGWTVDNGIDKMPSFYPTERFRKQLYRPDVITLLLDKGNLKDALETANAALKKEGKVVPEGVADPTKLLPPQATLQILDQKDLPQLKLKAAAVAAVKEQPVTALRLLVDGRPLPDRAGSAEFGQGQEKAEAEWTITLPEGKHQLAVLARSPDASAVSNVLEVASISPAQLPVLHVLAVGINAYQDSTLKLDFAAADAKAIAGTFTTSATGLFDKVVARPLLNEQATRAAVLAALAQTRQQVKANDLVVFFFAGHGVKHKDKFYLLTVEARTDELDRTALSGADLRKALGEFPCQVLLMLDACHSSASLKSFRPAVDDVTRELTEDEVGVAVLCAAMAHEKAEETKGNGLFTRAVVQALGRAEGVPFNRRDHRLYIHHLHSYVLDEVQALSQDRQHPFLSLPWVVESFPLAQFPYKGTQER